MRKRVLFAGEDTRCLDDLAKYFASQHYFILRATSQKDILNKAKINNPDATIIDIQNLRGNDFLGQLRKVTNTPIVVIDSKDDVEIRIQVLNLGIDAFFVKPVNNLEILTRLKAIFRRCEDNVRHDYRLLQLDDLEFDLETNSIKVQDQAVKITKTELAVLRHLAGNLDKVLTRDYLIEQVWGFWDVSDTRTIDTHIKKVRKILASLNAAWKIVTIPRVGFRLSRKADTNSVYSA